MNEAALGFIRLCIHIVNGYLIAGALFAGLFVIFFVGRIDESAHFHRERFNWKVLLSWLDTIGFRILIFPGIVAFWPLFAVRLLRGKTVPIERNAHRDRAARSS